MLWGLLSWRASPGAFRAGSRSWSPTGSCQYPRAGGGSCGQRSLLRRSGGRWRSTGCGFSECMHFRAWPDPGRTQKCMLLLVRRISCQDNERRPPALRIHGQRGRLHDLESGPGPYLPSKCECGSGQPTVPHRRTPACMSETVHAGIGSRTKNRPPTRWPVSLFLLQFLVQLLHRTTSLYSSDQKRETREKSLLQGDYDMI